MRRFLIVASVAAVVALAGTGLAVAAGTFQPVTVSACLSGGALKQVQVNKTPACASSATPVNWPGQAKLPASPSPSPSPTQTSPSPSPSPTGGACATLGQNCGPYAYSGIPMSNGFDTYIGPQNVGSNSGTTASVTAADPGSWTANVDAVPYDYGGVQVFANVQQLTNDWGGSGWNGSQDTPLNSLSALTINYSESMPRTSDISAEYAPDIWTEEYPSDIMFWADTQGRCNNGAYGGTVLGSATFGGQTWTVNRYGGAGAEIIFVLDSDPNTPDSCAQQTSGSIDIKAGLDWLENNGYISSTPHLTQINTGWEITSANHAAFTVNSYSITATP